jgi:hypothetical protein
VVIPRPIVQPRQLCPIGYQPRKNGHTSSACQPTRLPGGQLIQLMSSWRRRVFVCFKNGGGIRDGWMHASPCQACAMSLCSDREGVLLSRPLLEISLRRGVHGCLHNGQLAKR